MELSLDALRAAAARQYMAAFIKYTYSKYVMGWVHLELCEALDDFLQAVIRRESPRLMVAMPPRHGKSEATTRRFPAYAFGRYPDLSFISASYSDRLASDMNRDVQRIMRSDQYARVFPNTRLGGAGSGADVQYRRNTDVFEIVGARGSYRCMGVGGSINGMGADVLVIDDPIRGRLDADSKTIRDKVWDWYRGDAYQRLEPGGGIILINTRWHTDDLSGRLLEQQRTGGECADEWKLLSYPAIAEHDEEHRREGEPLHAARYDLKALRRLKATVGTRDWSAQFQQRPTPDGGVIFKKENVKFYTLSDLPARFDRISMSWDMSFKDSVGSDPVAGQVWGRKGADHYLLDQFKDKVDFVETVKRFEQMVEKWPKARPKYVEATANGPAVISALGRKISGIIPITPKGSKIARASAVSYLFEAGNVYLPDKSLYPWVDDLLDELLNFPTVLHDDQVDALTQYLNEATKAFKLTLNPHMKARISHGPGKAHF